MHLFIECFLFDSLPISSNLTVNILLIIFDRKRIELPWKPIRGHRSEFEGTPADLYLFS